MIKTALKVKPFWSLVICLGTLLTSPQALAVDAKALLKQRTTAVKTLKANFQQTVTQDGRVSKSRGRFELMRPSKFRWQVTSPQPQLIVSNGDKLWIFDKDLDQVTIRKITKEHKGTPALFLSGYDDEVAKLYDIQYQKKGNLERFMLKPVTKEGTYRFIELSYKNTQISSLRLEDELGQALNLSFSKQQVNKPLNTSRFNFKPPKGVDVVTE